MSFAPPPGPPPPSVPEGWKSQYDDRYKQWLVLLRLRLELAVNALDLIYPAQGSS